MLQIDKLIGPVLDGVLENVLQVYWVNFTVIFKGELIIKREGNLQDIP